MWENISVELVGNVVALEPLTLDHENELFEAARAAQIWEFTHLRSTDHPVALDKDTFAQNFLAILGASIEGVRVPFAIRNRRTRRLIGSSSYCTLRPKHLGLEIGWTWLNPASWGTGANIEAKLLMLQHAFDVLGCQRVEFETDAANMRSRRALEALPAQFEGILRDWKLVGGQRRSSALYSILDYEWLDVKDNLIARMERINRLGRRPTT